MPSCSRSVCPAWDGIYGTDSEGYYQGEIRGGNGRADHFVGGDQVASGGVSGRIHDVAFNPVASLLALCKFPQCSNSPFALIS